MMDYEIRHDPRQLMTIEIGPAPPDRTPDYPEMDLGANSSDWVDKLFRLFTPVMELCPPFTIIARVESDPGRYGKARAWIVPNQHVAE
jgi:hypothetical protein